MGFITAHNWGRLKKLMFETTLFPNIVLHFIGCLHTRSMGVGGGEYTEKVHQQTDQKGNRIFFLYKPSFSLTET